MIIYAGPLGDEATERVETALEELELEDFEKLQTSVELHFFADGYNWDNTTLKPLYWVLNHPLCDKGTALLLYWAASPESIYAEYIDRPDEKGYDQKLYDFIKEIEKRISTDYYTLQNLCYPTLASYKAAWFAKYEKAYKKQRIPEIMLDFASAELNYEED